MPGRKEGQDASWLIGQVAELVRESLGGDEQVSGPSHLGGGTRSKLHRAALDIEIFVFKLVHVGRVRKSRRNVPDLATDAKISVLTGDRQMKPPAQPIHSAATFRRFYSNAQGCLQNSVHALARN